MCAHCHTVFPWTSAACPGCLATDIWRTAIRPTAPLDPSVPWVYHVKSHDWHLNGWLTSDGPPTSNPTEAQHRIQRLHGVGPDQIMISRGLGDAPQPFPKEWWAPTLAPRLLEPFLQCQKGALI